MEYISSNALITKIQETPLTLFGDIMLKNTFVILAVSAIATIATPTNAQTDTESEQPQKYFLSEFFKHNPPECRIFYPEPIGSIPGWILSDKMSDDICSPPPIAIIPKYGKLYARLMSNAINAGIKGDYNTALINFRRAHKIELAQDFLGYRNREALRGINGAIVAKRYQYEPHPVKRLTPQYFWYYWTGTGDRGNWGKVVPDPELGVRELESK